MTEATSEAVVPIDARGRIDADLMCAGCDYNLRTQSPAGVCPECGQPIEDTIHADNALLMPPFWLGQVHRGAICLAVAWLTLPVCGVGLILAAIGIMGLCNDAPLGQFRARRLQRWTLGSMLLTGVAMLAVVFTGGLPFFGAGFALLSAAGVACTLTAVHLFARRTAQAARVHLLLGPAIALAVAGPILVCWVTALTALDMGVADVYLRHLAGTDWVDVLRAIMQYAWFPTVLVIIGYGLLDVVFWGAFAWSMRSVRDQALLVAQQRWTRTARPAQRAG